MGRKAGLGFRPCSLCPSGGKKTLPEPEHWPEPAAADHVPPHSTGDARHRGEAASSRGDVSLTMVLEQQGFVSRKSRLLSLDWRHGGHFFYSNV